MTTSFRAYQDVATVQQALLRKLSPSAVRLPLAKLSVWTVWCSLSASLIVQCYILCESSISLRQSE